MYSECSRFHSNRFTFGGVITERVNTAKSPREVGLNPIFGWSLASSRIMTNTNVKQWNYSTIQYNAIKAVVHASLIEAYHEGTNLSSLYALLNSSAFSLLQLCVGFEQVTYSHWNRVRVAVGEPRQRNYGSVYTLPVSTGHVILDRVHKHRFTLSVNNGRIDGPCLQVSQDTGIFYWTKTNQIARLLPERRPMNTGQLDGPCSWGNVESAPVNRVPVLTAHQHWCFV